MPQGGFLEDQQAAGFIPPLTVRVADSHIQIHEKFVLPRLRYRNVTTVELDIETPHWSSEGIHQERQTFILGPYSHHHTRSIELARQVLTEIANYSSDNFVCMGQEEVEYSFQHLLSRFGLDEIWPIDDESEYYVPLDMVRVVQWNGRGLPEGTVI